VPLGRAGTTFPTFGRICSEPWKNDGRKKAQKAQKFQWLEKGFSPNDFANIPFSGVGQILEK
jgi:hypothetical protein